jgi:hypothetical protein
MSSEEETRPAGRRVAVPGPGGALFFLGVVGPRRATCTCRHVYPARQALSWYLCDRHGCGHDHDMELSLFQRIPGSGHPDQDGVTVGACFGLPRVARMETLSWMASARPFGTGCSRSLVVACLRKIGVAVCCRLPNDDETTKQRGCKCGVKLRLQKEGERSVCFCGHGRMDRAMDTNPSKISASTHPFQVCSKLSALLSFCR